MMRDKLKCNLLELSCIILLLITFSTATAQYEDKSYLKKNDPNLAIHESKYIPESKYGPVVTPQNLAEALKNPAYYKSARFSNANLSEFPEQLFNFPYLEEIDLSHNSIKAIPQKVNSFKTLRELHINNNQLTSFGTEITSCPMLEVLQIQNNPLQKIAPEIGAMAYIREITIGEIAPQCVIPSALWTLTTLKKIKITNAHLTEIPTAIANLNQLGELCLANNSITQIPEELYSLKNITYVNLGYNKINAISPSIKRLANLDYLGIYYNPIASLPQEEIVSLNKLSFLSCWKTNIPNQLVEKIQKELPKAQIHNTETGIH